MTSLENLYRGPIHDGFKFRLAARLLPGISNTILPLLNINNGIEDPVFLLCLNRFSQNGKENHRFYWSNDPNDFVPQFYDDAQNQGAATFHFDKDINNYKLYYDTKLNTSKINLELTEYTVDTDFNTAEIIHNTASNFVITPYSSGNSIYTRNAPANVSDLIYASLEYNIFGGTSFVDWMFRTSTGNLGSSPKFIPSGPSIAQCSTGFNFYNLYSTVGISLSGHGSSVHYDSQVSSLSVSALTGNTGGLCFPDIPDNGILTLKSGIKTEFIKYDLYQDKTFYFSKDGLSYFQSDTIIDGSSTISGDINININLRNHVDNFKTLRSLNLGSLNGLKNTALEIFFIPESEHSYFSGGVPITRSQNLAPDQAGAIKFYDYQDGDIEHGFEDLRFFTNYMNGFLYNNFTHNTNPIYPKLPLYHKDDGHTTALIWTTMHESLNPYIYKYCTNDLLCGECMGLTETRSLYCHINHETVNNYINATKPISSGSTTSSTGVKAPPLASGKPDTADITIYVFIALVGILMFVAMILVHNEENKSSGYLSQIFS